MLCCRRLLQQCLYARQLVRCMSTRHNNLTFRMGLEDNADGRSRCAIVIDERTSFSYGDLAKRVACFVALLHSKYCLQRGERILARVEKNIDSLALYLATLRLGAIYVPLNPAYTPRETQHFIEDAEPCLFVTCNKAIDVEFIDRISHIVDISTLTVESHNMKPDYDIESVNSNDIACICYTSGTTGLPKGAMLSHGGLAWNADSLIETWRFTDSDILLHYLPFYHVHGMFISLNCSLFTHSCVIYRPKFDAEDALKWIPRSTVMMGVPTYYSRLLQQKGFNSDLTRKMRLFVSGSAPLSLPLWQEFRRRTGSAILERYGMTEAAVITSNVYEEEGRIPGSVGKILRGGEMRISESGIVEVKMPSVFQGYWRNPEKTRNEFTSDGFFITGDIGRIDDKGYLWILGRGKDLIISGGLNVYPKEVEDTIDSLPYIQESAVIGVPHVDFGEAVVAICVPRTSTDREKAELKIFNELRSKLANYKLPKKTIFIDALPRNSMGKVQKNLLRDRYKKLFQ
uniref:Malonyl-CoA synthase n=1 Tax=Ascaris lumbricoides TaxID=6252 RepID=A0A0M3I2V3_ASCLU